MSKVISYNIERFSNYHQFGRSKTDSKLVLNPTKNDYEKFGRYLPNITIQTRANNQVDRQHVLKVQFSAPKMIYDNNFQEIDECEFGELCYGLNNTLKYFQIIIEEYSLKESLVTKIHYSKNIILHESKVTEVINEFKSAKHSLHKQDREAIFQDSFMFAIRTNSFEFTIYDKYKDYLNYNKSPRKAYDKANQYNHLPLFNFDKQIQIARIELRLNNAREIYKFLKNNGLTMAELKLEKLFSKSISQKLLFNQLKEIAKEIPYIQMDKISELKEFAILQNFNKHIKSNELLIIMNLKRLRVGNSYQDMLNCINISKKTLDRYLKLLGSLKLPTNMSFRCIDEIINGIMRFEIVREIDFKFY